MKIASWNVNSLRVRLAHVIDWINTNQPDVLGMQETKVVDADFPSEAFTDLGYQVSFSGQKTYNGVALISKQPAQDPLMALPDFVDEAKRFSAATFQGIRVINVYVPNGAAVDSDKYHYKLNWLAALEKHLKHALKQYEQLIIMGDFNIAPEDRDVHDPQAWQGKVLVSPLERQALARLLDLGLRDSFRLFEQDDNAFSWWDYRAAGFRRNAGLRIDLLLLSETLAQRCQGSYIDKAPRKLEKPSDHAPVWVQV